MLLNEHMSKIVHINLISLKINYFEYKSDILMITNQ